MVTGARLQMCFLVFQGVSRSSPKIFLRLQRGSEDFKRFHDLAMKPIPKNEVHEPLQEVPKDS